MIKTFIDIRDSRWEKYKIDYAHIVNAALDCALRTDKTESIIKKSTGMVAPWMPSVGFGGAFGKIAREVSIILTNDSEIRALNKKYRKIDKPTNVLSFETGDAELLGDIYISFDTAMKESKQEKKDFIKHATHLVLHGVLHLMGYDHLNDLDARKMESEEIKILSKFGIVNPYAEQKENSKKPKKKNKNTLFSVGAFLFGIITSFGFAPFNLWGMTIIGIGAAYYLIPGRERAIRNSMLFGAAYAMASFWWVLNSIFVVPELTAQFRIWTVPGIIGIGIIGALVFSLPFVITNRCMSRYNASTSINPFVFSASWALVLWLREWLFTGFPWNPIANISLGWTTFSNSMSLWGAIGLTFIIVGLIASMVELIKNKKRIPIIIFSLLMMVGIFYGNQNIKKAENNNQKSQIIRIVQPAQSGEQKASHSREQAITNAKENIKVLLNLAKAEGAPDIIVFPETSYPFVILQDKDELGFAKELGQPVIVGATSWKNGSFYNSMIIADRNGKIEKIYSKTHLVPFGEYRPFGDIIPTPGQLERGNGPEEIVFSGLNFVPAICYEVIFSDSLVPYDGNPQMIINLTNDTWFGKTSGTYQHLDMIRRQAIEMGLPVIRANYSGISAFVGADGRVISSLPVGVSGVLDGQVWGAHQTPFRRIGLNWTMIIILVFSMGCVFSLKKHKD
jgi:apolipoprotein N-acyltransferase